MSVVLKVTRSTFGGEGIASHEGKVCFVPGALPGETVEADIVQDKKNFLRARLLKVLAPSPDRTAPECEHYGYCGGCQYQHVSSAAERRFKEAQVAETLEHLAGLKVPVRPIVHAEAEYGYRNSVTFRITRPSKTGRPVLSYTAADNVSSVGVKHCGILDRRFDVLLDRPFTAKPKTEKIAFKLSEKGEIVSDEEERFFRVRLAGESLLVNSKGFFQTNLRVTELLTGQVKHWLAEAAPDAFFDLYAGVGTFTWLCAAGIPRIFCVEESPFSVAALKMNREERKASHVELVEGRVEKAFGPLWERVSAQKAAVLVDPPRQGLEASLAKKLGTLEGAGTLLYISCDIPTLARDLRLILAGGRFDVREVVPFDMFPRTKHIEAAVLLTSA